MTSALETFTLLIHPRPRPPSHTELDPPLPCPPLSPPPPSSSGAERDDNRLSISDLTLLPPHPFNQANKGSQIPVRPLSQLSNRARKHSAAKRERERKPSLSHARAQSHVQPSAQPSMPIPLPSAAGQRRASHDFGLSKSTNGHGRKPSFSRLDPNQIPEDQPARPNSQLSLSHLGHSKSRPISKLDPVPDTPAKLALSSSDFRPSIARPPAFRLGSELGELRPPLGLGTSALSASQLSTLTTRQRLVEEQRAAIAYVQQAAAASIVRERERERAAAAAALCGRRELATSGARGAEGKGGGGGGGGGGKSEAEKIKDAYRAQTAIAPAAPQAPPSHELSVSQLSRVPAKPTPQADQALSHHRRDAAPTCERKEGENKKPPFPMPLKVDRKRWDPASGAPLIRSSVLASVPGAVRWSEAEYSSFVRLGEELGYGNWGSVTTVQLSSRCPLLPSSSALQLSQTKTSTGRKQVYAAKIVLFETEPKTAEIRMWALWKEFQILRGKLPSSHPSTILWSSTQSRPSDPAEPSSPREPQQQDAEKEERHPGILDPLSFIEFPKGGMMVMPLLRRQMPVCVREEKARRWFGKVLEAVGWLHDRGVVHNDIKPANIMLTEEDQPVLIDFGFAQHHPPSAGAERFLSQLAFGTPEYLSPERARGESHDTRKSDVYSLGVTFFEVLVGRTPFENTPAPSLSPSPSRSASANPASEAEPEKVKADPDMSTPEGLKLYWERTKSGTWVGEWDFSPGAERLFRRMMSPRPEERPFALECLEDAYFSASLALSKSQKDAAVPVAPVHLPEAGQTPQVPVLGASTRERKASIRSPHVEADKGSLPPTPAKVHPSRIPVYRDRVDSKPKPRPAFEIPRDRATSTPALASPAAEKKAKADAPLSPIKARVGKENRIAAAAVPAPALQGRKALGETKRAAPRGDFELKKEKEKAVENILLAKRERRKTTSPLPPLPIKAKAAGGGETKAPVINRPPLSPPLEDDAGVESKMKTSLARTPSLGANQGLMRSPTGESQKTTREPPAAIGRKKSERVSNALARSYSASVDLGKMSRGPVKQSSGEVDKENVAPASREERLSNWLKSLDKVVEDTKATFGEPPKPVLHARIPLRSTGAKQTTRPALRDLFDLPPPLPASTEAEGAQDFSASQPASSEDVRQFLTSPVPTTASVQTQEVVSVPPLPAEFGISPAVSYAALSPRSGTPISPPHSQVHLVPSFESGMGCANAPLPTSSAMKAGNGYEYGTGTVRRARKGFTFIEPTTAEGTANETMIAQPRQQRSRILKPKSKKSQTDDGRSSSVMSFFTLPRSVTSPTPTTPRSPPVSIPPLSPEPIYSPPMSPTPPKSQRNSAVLKLRRAIKSVFHRRPSVAQHDLESMNMLGFVPVAPAN